MSYRHLLAAAALCCGAFSAQATSVALAGDGTWQAFDISIDQAPGYNLGFVDVLDGSPLLFNFSIAAGQTGTLTVVDAVFAGDTFSIFANGAAIGSTSAVSPTFTGTNVGYDYDAALADPAYSRGTFEFGPGQYSVTGRLLASALDDTGAPFNATNGALKLAVAPVPEPGALALMAAGFGLLRLRLRRRAA